MTHVVQFTNLPDFISDLDHGEATVVYHELLDQRVARFEHGLTRWLLTTVIRAIVANGLGNGKAVAHVAALTIPHGAPIELLYGQPFGPPGGEKDAQARRWETAKEQHAAIIDYMMDLIGFRNYVQPGLLNVPNDLAPIYADNPLAGNIERVSEDLADFHPGGDGLPD